MSLGGTRMRRRRARPSEAPWRCAAGDGRGDRTRGTCRQRYGMGIGTLVRQWHSEFQTWRDKRA